MKLKTIKNQLLTIITAVVIAFIPAKLIAKEARVTVEVWYHSGSGESVKHYLNQTHPELQIQSTEIAEANYDRQVNQAALAGKLPCLLHFDGPWLYKYAWSGYLRTLDKYVSAELRQDLLSSILQQGTYKGKLYGLGQFDSGLAILGNKVYLNKANVRIPTGIEDAWDKEEFLMALKKLQALDEVKYAIDLKLNYGIDEWLTYAFSPLLQSFGGDLIDRNTYKQAQGVLNGPAAVAAMTFLQNLFTAGYALANPKSNDDFHLNKITALSWVGHWMWQPAFDALGDDLVLIPMPKLGDRAVTGMGSWQWGITTTCSHPNEAWQILNALLSPAIILEVVQENGAIPARKSAIARSKRYAPGGDLNLLVQQLEHIAIPRPATAAYPTITRAFAEAVRQIITGAGVKTALDQAVEQIDKDIEKNLGYY